MRAGISGSGEEAKEEKAKTKTSGTRQKSTYCRVLEIKVEII